MAKTTNSFTGHRPFENARLGEIRGFINTWLRDPKVYCNYCGSAYFPDRVCCEKPEIGRNIDFCGAIIQQNRDTLLKNFNALGASQDLNMRMGLSLPQDLLRQLESWHLKRFGFKLFEKKKHYREFMKEFPQFRICEKI